MDRPREGPDPKATRQPPQTSYPQIFTCVAGENQIHAQPNFDPNSTPKQPQNNPKPTPNQPKFNPEPNFDPNGDHPQIPTCPLKTVCKETRVPPRDVRGLPCIVGGLCQKTASKKWNVVHIVLSQDNCRRSSHCEVFDAVWLMRAKASLGSITERSPCPGLGRGFCLEQKQKFQVTPRDFALRKPARTTNDSFNHRTG